MELKGIVDMHCDTLSEYGILGRNSGQLDIKRLKEQGYLLQNFAMFVDMAEYEDPWARTLELADIFQAQMKICGKDVCQVFTWEDICNCAKEGKIAALLTMEEGGVCAGDLERLRHLYDLGVRMMTITWNYPNELGAPAAYGERIYRSYEQTSLTNADMPRLKIQNEEGLTHIGLGFVREMEHLGMIPDVSHLSDAGFWQVAENTRRPFVASHSNARSLCNHPRNLTDDMIKCVGERGGCIGLNFCEKFISKEPTGRLEALAGHAKHITNVGGMEVLGLGSDFDGIPQNPELKGVQDMPGLYDALKHAGFTENQLDLLFGQNVLRVYQEWL